MNFLEHIFDRLRKAADATVLQEARERRLVGVTGGELLRQVAAARAFVRSAGLRKGDRCALLGHNSIRWAALDLALMAEGIIVVPLYARQAPAELVAMMKDCQPSLICCGDAALREAIAQAWPAAPQQVLFDEIVARFAPAESAHELPAMAAGGDPVTIIYTSGTSGEAKGVILNAGNLNHMLRCTAARLDLLMGPREEPDRVFHYLPFCFAGSWILLLSCLSRSSVLTLSTNLSKLADELRLAAPQYFLNVPTLLERMRSGIQEQLSKRGGLAQRIFENGEAEWKRRQDGAANGSSAWLALAKRLMFPAIRKRLGPNLKALICGSAPLAKETQLFFEMLGVPVLQVYGLTETTAICTLDDPRRVVAGRVGPAIDGAEMRVGENEEILVRGPTIFPRYWNRPEETARVLRDGWFHTGDQGEVDAEGNWRIIGRLKNLIILNSGHNIAPEPIEEMLLRRLPGAQQVVLTGNGRSFLSAIVTGDVSHEQAAATIEAANQELPHYKRIHAFHVEREPFTIENRLLTANGKLKRDAIAARFATQIEEFYSETVR